ncbi:d-ribulose-5-phosphate 3 epimerase [Metamycoplasma cloacale]|uniref:Ribulose-phosphate 3-epimerase n=1 Tax=Metamycoplasma cloacale TaxID=92401 RepID=A0A2Z4LMJ6_9BACT|nr:ribulose-phosphate 3-epimerase [Metamycoplasma cloacale]AWX42999.1 ribulose-phosphate 3-epimerase [Metamycoplasma cloacale]VEU79648.1 d-ribulose-5-phosphate 3 epimerase [Metamycoplasma cloacale]
MRKISPSVLDVKRDNLIEYINNLINWGVTNVHYDIMDNIFVPNVALQFKEVKKVKELCKKHTMDIHLMVKDVFGYYEMYKNVGDILTFHLESFNSYQEFLELVALAKKDNVKLGLSINPDTKVEQLIPYIEHLSLVLIMSVYPGLGGQKFIDNSLNKVKELKELLIKSNSSAIIQIDGGVKDFNIKDCFDSGVNLAVVGSYLVNNFSKETVDKLLK